MNKKDLKKRLEKEIAGKEINLPQLSQFNKVTNGDHAQFAANPMNTNKCHPSMNKHGVSNYKPYKTNTCKVKQEINGRSLPFISNMV